MKINEKEQRALKALWDGLSPAVDVERYLYLGEDATPEETREVLRTLCHFFNRLPENKV